MKATASAHPIQGLIKYHGLRDDEKNIPYHDSISVCTAPSETRTTVEFGYESDVCFVNNAEIDDEGYHRVTAVLDRIRELSDIDTFARVESHNNFESNVGLGASASAFAALASAATTAAGLDLTQKELSALARRGATSAARSVTGGFSHLHSRLTDTECVAEPIEDGFKEDIRIVIGFIPEYKRTSRAHKETPRSPLFEGRLSYIHQALDDMRNGIRTGDFDSTFALAEKDSLSLLAATMTGPERWIYWQPETLQLFKMCRNLREKGIPVFFSSDTGATAYLNTTAEFADDVAEQIESLGLESRIWRIGGGVETKHEHLF